MAKDGEHISLHEGHEIVTAEANGKSYKYCRTCKVEVVEESSRVIAQDNKGYYRLSKLVEELEKEINDSYSGPNQSTNPAFKTHNCRYCQDTGWATYVFPSFQEKYPCKSCPKGAEVEKSQ